MRILLVEDDPGTALTLRHDLTAAGFAVEHRASGSGTVERINTQPYNAVIISARLRDFDGIGAVKELRAGCNSTPVLLLAANGDVSQRIEGLNAGADDAVPRPFVSGEIVARLHALTRRGGAAHSILLRVKDLALDVRRRVAIRENRVIDLSAREFRLLEVLMRHAGQICPRSMLLQQVWEYDYDPGTNLVDVYVRKLREKIDTPFPSPLLRTVRGAGYIIDTAPDSGE